MQKSLVIPTDFGHKLEVEYSTRGPGFHFTYVESGHMYPPWFANITWAYWDGLVAYIEQQRADEALQEAKQKKE